MKIIFCLVFIFATLFSNYEEKYNHLIDRYILLEKITNSQYEIIKQYQDIEIISKKNIFKGVMFGAGGTTFFYIIIKIIQIGVNYGNSKNG